MVNTSERCSTKPSIRDGGGTSTTDIISEYLAYLTTERGLSPATVEAYERDIGKLMAWIRPGCLSVFTLRHKDLREFVKGLNYDGYDPRSVHRIIAGIRGFFRFLLYDGHIVADPSEGLIRPQAGEKLPRFLNHEEVQNLLDETPGPQGRAVCELLYGSGLRASEVCGLRLCDVDLDKGIVTVTGKGNKTRRVPMSMSSRDWAWQHILYNIHEDDAEQSLFSTSKGPLTRQDVWLIVTTAAKRACLPDVYPHTLRHTFATHLAQRNTDVRFIQSMLGHERIDTTAVYTHITSDQLRATYDRCHPRS